MAGWGVELRKGPGFGVYGAVSLNHKEAQCSEVPVEPIPPMPDDIQ